MAEFLVTVLSGDLPWTSVWSSFCRDLESLVLASSNPKDPVGLRPVISGPRGAGGFLAPWEAAGGLQLSPQ